MIVPLQLMVGHVLSMELEVHVKKYAEIKKSLGQKFVTMARFYVLIVKRQKGVIHVQEVMIQVLLCVHQYVGMDFFEEMKLVMMEF